MLLAKLQIKGTEEIELQLSKLADLEFTKEIVEAGAQPLADEIRKSINNLPEEEDRYLKKGEKFKGIPKRQKKDLLDSLGITPADVDYGGNTNIKVGFDGYGSSKTKKYPQGLPNPLLARAIESGSTVRVKKPFIRPATNRMKKKVNNTMQLKIDEKIYAITKG